MDPGRNGKAWKNALESNFLQCLSIDGVLLSSCGLQDERGEFSTEDVLIIAEPEKNLHGISIVSKFENLQICNLGSNFISNFSSLRHCRLLVKLDLHGNQISRIPSLKFWQHFQRLLVLCLHDNNIHDAETIKNLSGCRNLTILTLKDTPASLNKFYRHLAVNAIWSLKCLDDHVVSDEEIIEDAKFEEKFSSLSIQFSIKNKLLSTNGRKLDFITENQSIVKDLALINRIQAKYCPVLFIQRQIRGLIQRKIYKEIMENRLWAAVSIQRFYRKYKGIPDPPPCSPISKHPTYFISNGSLQKPSFDSYVHRNASCVTQNSNSSREFYSTLALTDNDAIEDGKRLRINVHIPKLEQSLIDIIKNDTSVILPQPGKTEMLKEKKHISLKKDIEQKSQSIKSSFRNLSVPEQTSKRKPHFNENPIVDIKTDCCFVDGKSEKLQTTNRLKDHYTEIVQTAELIRESIQHGHEKVEQKIHLKFKDIINKQHRIKRDGIDGMKLSCLRAIDRAYGDKKKIETQIKRENFVQSLRIEEEIRKANVQNYKIKKQREAIQKKVSEDKRNKIPNDSRSPGDTKIEVKKINRRYKLRAKEKAFNDNLIGQLNKISKAVFKQKLEDLNKTHDPNLTNVRRSREKEQWKPRDYFRAGCQVIDLEGTNRKQVVLDMNRHSIMEPIKNTTRFLSDRCHQTNQSLTGTSDEISCQKINIGEKLELAL